MDIFLLKKVKLRSTVPGDARNKYPLYIRKTPRKTMVDQMLQNSTK